MSQQKFAVISVGQGQLAEEEPAKEPVAMSIMLIMTLHLGLMVQGSSCT